MLKNYLQHHYAEGLLESGSIKPADFLCYNPDCKLIKGVCNCASMPSLGSLIWHLPTGTRDKW